MIEGPRRGHNSHRVTVFWLPMLIVAASFSSLVSALATPPAKAAALHPRSVALPGCSTASASAPPLKLSKSFTTVGQAPFGVAMTADGRYGFVGLADSIGVLSIEGGRFALRHEIPIGTEALGLALTPDGHELIAAAGEGAVVLDTAKAEQGTSAAVLGTFTAAGTGAIETTVSPDSHFIFVSMEDSAEAEVFNLARALQRGFSITDYVGAVPLNEAPVGLAISSDGRYLYATSEVLGQGGSSDGTLTTINLSVAEREPADSVVSTVLAGCSPVRVAVSGNDVYVTARESDTLLQYSAPALRGNPSAALSARVEVGEAPVGLAIVDHGSAVVVADSDRFGTSGATSRLALVRVSGDHLNLVGYLPAGAFPRDIASNDTNGRVLISNYGSDQVEEVSLPAQS